MVHSPRHSAHAGSGLDAGSSVLADPALEPGTGAVAGATSGDRSFDFSLRLLTVLVLAALAGSVGLLAYQWLAPYFSLREDGKPITLTTTRPQAGPAPAAPAPAHGDEVLMAPGRVFRCEEQGRVTFSDRACTGEAGGPAAPPATR